MRAGVVKPDVSHADYLAIFRAHAALSEGDSMVASRHLATLEDVAIRDEVDAVIRAGQYDDAMLRLHRFTNPKYPSSDECKAHVGNPNHFNPSKQGSLL